MPREKKKGREEEGGGGGKHANINTTWIHEVNGGLKSPPKKFPNCLCRLELQCFCRWIKWNAFKQTNKQTKKTHGDGCATAVTTAQNSTAGPECTRTLPHTTCSLDLAR